jgi:hypothetical protein
MGTPSKDAKTWAMLAHLLALVGLVIPFGNIIAPLIVWLVKKDEHPFVDDQGKESLNYQIGVTILMVLLLAVGTALLAVCVGIVVLALALVLAIAVIIFVIIAAIKANEGVAYRYPGNVRFIK